jgi:DNA helicase-2/ATP-dependent DNA helicase PcrA
MQYANILVSGIPGLEPGEAVVRHGGEVETFTVISERERAFTVAERVRFRLAQGHANVAVITRTLASAKALAKLLPQTDMPEFTLLNGSEYSGGVSLLSAALSKGLEFDAVVIADGGAYENTPADMRLKYVACTRAMHTLDVVV